MNNHLARDERLIAIILLGIVVSIAVPSFVGAKDRARNTTVMTNVGVIAMGIERYAADHAGAPPDVAGSRELVKVLTQGKGYLPENRMPASPWGNVVQNVVIPAVRVATQDPPARLQGATTTPSAIDTILGDGEVAETIGGTPPDARKYGAICYDRAGSSFVLYGTGKRGKRARIVASLANTRTPPRSDTSSR